MGQPSIPPLASLEQPEKLNNLLAQDKAVADDCTPCRVTGAAAFMGLGAYSYFSGHKQLEQQRAAILKSGSMFGMKSRQAGISGIAFTLGVIGFWRLVN